MSKTSQPVSWRLENLDSARPIHLAGIAGSAMSGLARLLCQRGYRVIGTDSYLGDVASRLIAEGIEIYAEQDGSRIAADTQLVVSSAALPSNHRELVKAREKGIKVVKYSEALGALMAGTTGVAVAGTHGKSTTTAMIVAALRRGGLDPGFIVGGMVPDLDSSSSSGSSPIFVAEACEYDRSFHKLSPVLAVITNIEADHLDYYRDLAEIRRAFLEFARLIPKNGALVYSAACENTASIIGELECPKMSFGIDRAADYSAQDVRFGPDGTIFDFYYVGEPVCSVQLAVPGRHNVANALAAIAVCHGLNLPLVNVASSLKYFNGVSRRFEVLGQARGITVVDDYAHHPTEIRALLEACTTRFAGHRLVVVFQPHQSSRTRLLLEDFAQAFRLADLVLLPDIYSARESEKEMFGIDSAVLAKKIEETGVKVEYVGSLENAVVRLESLLAADDVLVTAGAGDVYKVATTTLTSLKKTSNNK